MEICWVERKVILGQGKRERDKNSNKFRGRGVKGPGRKTQADFCLRHEVQVRESYKKRNCTTDMLRQREASGCNESWV